MMVKAARHLASFIDDIADISRAEIHKLSVSIEPVPAGSVIADALDLIRPLSASHGVHLDPPPPASQHVFADPRRLRQVLLNLLSNAVKYNHPAGRVAVNIESRPDERLRICIRDTGRGIADYDIGQLFTPFQRLDAARVGIEGAGLGLTLSRQLVVAMGGSIGATSARRLRADPATSATPVVIISGDTSGERIASLMAMGASAYLTKPISVRNFLHTVDTLLTRPAAAAAAPGVHAGAGAQAREAALQPEKARRDDAECEDVAPDQPRPE